MKPPPAANFHRDILRFRRVRNNEDGRSLGRRPRRGVGRGTSGSFRPEDDPVRRKARLGKALRRRNYVQGVRSVSIPDREQYSEKDSTRNRGACLGGRRSENAAEPAAARLL